MDSDPQWVTSVQQHPDIATKIQCGVMSVLHGDIGPVKEWGNPASYDHIRQWPNYISTAWTEWARRGTLPDLVLVDGRFRVACCLSVVVAFANGSRGNPLTLIHDFNDERPQYRDVLEFFDLEEQEGSLAALRIKPGASSTLAFSKLLHRQFDYG